LLAAASNCEVVEEPTVDEPSTVSCGWKYTSYEQTLSHRYALGNRDDHQCSRMPWLPRVEEPPLATINTRHAAGRRCQVPPLLDPSMCVWVGPCRGATRRRCVHPSVGALARGPTAALLLCSGRSIGHPSFRSSAVEKKPGTGIVG
jgi:hypothetical protein